MSDFEGETFPTPRMGTSPHFHFLPPSCNHLDPEIISLSDDFDLERMSGNFLEEGTSSSGSLENLLSNVGREVTHAKVPLPPRVLSGEEIHANHQRREHAKNYILLRLKINNCETSNAEVKSHLDLRAYLGAI